MTDKCDKWDFDPKNRRSMTTEGDAIELLRQFLILRRDTFDEFADKAVAAFGVVSAELTRLRERNAELERESVSKNEAMLVDCARIASLEAKLEAFRAAAKLLEGDWCFISPGIISPDNKKSVLCSMSVFDAIMSALASSESVVKSDGEKDGVE